MSGVLAGENDGCCLQLFKSAPKIHKGKESGRGGGEMKGENYCYYSINYSWMHDQLTVQKPGTRDWPPNVAQLSTGPPTDRLRPAGRSENHGKMEEKVYYPEKCVCVCGFVDLPHHLAYFSTHSIIILQQIRTHTDGTTSQGWPETAGQSSRPAPAAASSLQFTCTYEGWISIEAIEKWLFFIIKCRTRFFRMAKTIFFLQFVYIYSKIHREKNQSVCIFSLDFIQSRIRQDKCFSSSENEDFLIFFEFWGSYQLEGSTLCYFSKKTGILILKEKTIVDGLCCFWSRILGG